MKKSIIIRLFLAFAFNSQAQVTSSDSLLNAFIDEVLEEKHYDLDELIDAPKNYHVLYFNAMYSPKTTYAGREIGDNAANTSGQIFYFISNGLYMGISGVYYQDFTPHYQSTPVMIGYSNGEGHFRYRASYSHYFYHIQDYEPSYSNSLSTGISFIKKPYGFRADYSLSFGKETDSKLSLDAYANLKLAKFNGNSINLEPQLSFDFGSETVETEIALNASSGYSYTEEDVFGLMNTALSLPLSISLGSFMFEAEYTYNLTRSLDPNYVYPNSHVLNFSLGYIIGLN